MLSPCNTTVDGTNRELLAHGTGAFPVGCYHDDLCRGEVVWHWHEELEAAGDGPHFELAVRASLSELVALLLDYRQAVPHGSEEGRALRDSERIKTMLAFVHSHFAEPLTVADIARSAAVSPSECLRCFRRTIGRTPAQYLRDCRLRRAAELLSGTDLPVAQVAADCGFDDVSYFTRVFRACRQATPTAYRRGGPAGTA